MTKDEWIWVAIRIFGIYLLVLAIMALPETIGYVYASIQMNAVEAAGNDLMSLATSIRNTAMSKGLIAITQVIIFTAFSFYFLRHGKWLHKLASSENA